MAARRFLSLVTRRYPQNSTIAESILKFQPVTSSSYQSHLQHIRECQTVAESSQTDFEKKCDSNPGSGTVECIPDSPDNKTGIHHSADSKLKISERHDSVMIFTCKVCDTRSFKTVCKESYEKGVVVARCDGCNNLHLIADRLGWFGEPGSVEDFLAARGEEVKKGSMETLNLTFEDIAGSKILNT